MGLQLLSTGDISPWDGTIKPGYFLSGGEWYVSGGVYCTDLIPVSGGLNYTGRGGNRFRTRWENAAGAVVGYEDYSPNPSTPITVTAPATAVRLYVYYANAAGYTFEIYEGEEIGEPGGYAASGVAVYGPILLGDAGTYVDSLISWSSTVPADTSLVVKTALREDGDTPDEEDYVAATSGQAISGFSAQEDLTDVRLWIRVEMATTDDQSTPELSALSFSVNGPEDPLIIQITLTGAGRFKYPQGDVRIQYSKLLGGLIGADSKSVDDFDLNFSPVNIGPIVFNPGAYDHLTAAVCMTVAVNEVDYKYIPAEDNTFLVVDLDNSYMDENISAQANLTVVVTKVGSLPL